VIDLDAVREQTPGARSQVFLDSAGSSLMPTPVFDTVLGHLRRESEVGGYRAAQERAEELESGYGVLARLLGCNADEVAFTDSATRSWLCALDAVPLGAGDRILITEVEYASNAVALIRRAEEVGASIEILPSDASGAVSVEALEALLDERVKLVSLVHVPTNGGLVNPVREVVDAAHRVGALVLLDACQSIGQLSVDFHATGADLMAGTGRKWLRGPRGTGLLAVRKHVLERLRPKLVDLRGGTWVSAREARMREDARVFELWEHGVAERLGLIAAAAYADRLGIASIEAEVLDRATRLRRGLASVPGAEVRDLGVRQCGIVSFTVEGHEPAEVRDVLVKRGITVSVSGQSTLLDMHKRGFAALVRASPHYFVTPEQINECVDAVANLKAMS